MPLPSFLVGSYKRYKADTERFATWLAETAKKCAEASGTSLPMRDTTSSESKYTIALNDFTKFSEFIAKNGSSRIEVPPLITIVARRAISLRRRFADQFKSKLEEGNRGHRHFIQVLEKALQTLGVADIATSPATSPATSSTTAAPNTAARVSDEAVNRFSVLDLEEPVESEDGPSSKKAKTLGSDGIKFELEDEFDSDLEASYLAFFCLLEDLKHIRNFVLQTWSDYRQGKVDLMSASVTTNTALALGRQAIEQVEENKAFPRGEGEFQMVTYNILGMAEGKDPDKKQADEPFNMELYDVADYCYVGPVSLLGSFCEVLVPGTVPQYKKGYFGTYYPNRNRSHMSGSEKFNEDLVVLLQALPSFACIALYNIPIPGEDELTKGLREMIKTKKVSFWLCFATQVYLDIHHTLRADVSKGFQEVRLTGLRSKKILDDHFKFSQQICRSPNWTQKHDAGLKGIQETIERFIVSDVLSKAAGMNTSPVPKEDEFSFLKWHPVQSGLLMFNINMRMQEMGTQLVSAWGSVIYLAYLYNTVQKEGMVSVDWPDMDKIIEYHTEGRIFIGSKPNSIEDSYKKLCIMMGCSAQSFAAKKVIQSKNGPRGLEESTTVAKLFRDCYTRGGSLDLSLANVTCLLDDLAQAETSKKSPSAPQASKKLKRKWQATQTLSPLQLLAALRERLIEEEPRLLFNYFGMHKRGIELMRLIRTELKDKLVQYFGPKHIEAEYQLAIVIMLIFHVALGSGKAAKMMKLAPAGGQSSSRLIMRAGTVMQNYLRDNGSVACKELRAFCKNEKHTKEEAVKEGNRREENTMYWFGIEEILDPRQMASLATGIPLS